ncbi:hypothetical protein [Parasulfitobacter algicola]|uniref:Uncharacterized protein n=1 Tax=Parasulfitobacter algicola TaxID=2614809 RepID=A0ABX2ISR2_9RHOB|nr:hypothetical protein [Sulfitobacter algicola]NSX53248.1 hypothetical protein [Sulfitobacter algicola]
MEALLLIIGELLVFAIYPFLSVIFGIVAAILEAVVTFFIMIFQALFEAKRDKKTEQKTPDQAPAPIKRKRRKYLHWIAVPLVFVGVAVVTINYLAFDAAVGLALGQIEKRTDYEIEYTGASGDIFTGQLTIRDLEIRDRTGLRDTGLMMGFAENLEIDVNMWTLLSRDVVIEKLVLNDAVGTIVLPPKREKQNTDRSQRDGEPRRKRGFTVNDLAFSDISIIAIGADQKSHSLQIAQATSQPFRSHMAVFDLFLRSNLDANVNDVPLVVRTTVLSEYGRRTEWRFDDVPVTTAASFVDRAPFTWLNGGTISAHVQDEWDLTDDYIDMDWQLDLKDTKIDAPDDAGRTQRLVISVLDKVVEDRGGNASLGFQMRFDQDGLRNGATTDMTVFWDALLDGVIKAISDNLGERAEETEERINTLGDRIKGIFQSDDQIAPE